MRLQALATNSNVTMDISVCIIQTTVMDTLTAMMGVMKMAVVSRFSIVVYTCAVLSMLCVGHLSLTTPHETCRLIHSKILGP